MKLAVFLSLVGLVHAVAQPAEQAATGLIYGTVIGNNGSPARGLRLTACPLGVPLATVLPWTQTDQRGNYRFEKLPWWGSYSVYADDPDAGYSLFSTGTAGPGLTPEADISPEHPEARLDLRLPPKAGFLQIHLTNRLTGAVIAGLQVAVMSRRAPHRLIFSAGSGSARAVLIPPGKDLLLHVTSPGFQEWRETAGRGKPIRMRSGSRRNLYVQLTPE